MLVDEVLVLLGTIADLPDEDTGKYTGLIEVVASPYMDKELSEKDQKRLALYLASKVNYQLCAGSQNDISSFSAGDIKVTSKESKSMERARMIMESALEVAGDLVEDKGFSFMEV